MSGVLVINADLDPLQTVSLNKAVRMLWRQVAVVHEETPGGHRIGPYAMPRVLRLLAYVVPKWRYTRGPTWSKHAVLSRDQRRCGYCAEHATTIDHILPVSRGGQNTFTNTVAACYRCNQAKGDRTPDDAGMRLLVKPVTPTWQQAFRR